jgi:glycosyltransferase involved in cell wall biosynthesis
MPVPKGPVYSVIVPAYNCAPYLADAIESVLRQTIGREQVEIIVVDDGSTDRPDLVVSQFGDAVRFVQVEHGGVSKARNRGVLLARAPFVAFLDADDYWFPRRLEQADALLQSDPHAMVTTDFYLETDGVRAPLPYYQARGLRCLFELSAGAQFDFALEANFITMVIAPREALIAQGGFNEQLRYGEDWDLWLRMLKAGYPARLVPEPGAVYRYKRPGATTTRHDLGMARDLLLVLSRYREAVSEYRWRRSVAIARRLAARQLLRRFVPFRR